MDAIGGQAFRKQIGGAPARRCKTPARNRVGQAAVHFLRPRGVVIVGAQTGLDMAKGHALIKGGQGRTEDGSGVALRQESGRA